MPGLTSESVLRATFQPTKFRNGYDQNEVDDFLDTVIQLIKTHEEGGSLDAVAAAELCANARFATTKFREGYDTDDVDALLDTLTAGFRAIAGGRSPVPAPPQYAPPVPGQVVTGRFRGTTGASDTGGTGATGAPGTTTTTSPTPDPAESTRPMVLIAVLVAVAVLVVVGLVAAAFVR